ncbi:hypothetical protein [Campylobacter pinnipediorum]|uniref:Uncharacterized protein n=1 Tax=Campylobacter pinnipediorum subsp. pinnipediorum TaxID=1660067 RepID=A0AAX0L9V1_9BACT|nr:hypothetical protein [Campylobacter pinnipediorum]AQW82900.1 hypothetical protein CPIN17261_0890 [Campylobacter pinnipediorum subsp. pinnipediorum]OPA77242.1 hypothetical protein BFG04_03865 [Campylobacter pinnipediorum subsp. pinnipediorum]
MNRLELKGSIYEAREEVTKAQNLKNKMKNDIVGSLNEPLNFNLLFGYLESLKTADETIKSKQKEIQVLQEQLNDTEEL